MPLPSKHILSRIGPVFASASIFMLLAGCNSSTDNDGPVGVTAEEAQMLDDAAEMLDERQADFDKALSQQPDAEPAAEQ